MKAQVKTRENNVEARKYDLFMIVAMIIGIVIGSGIFTKNQSIIGETGDTSSIIAMSGWIFMSVIVFAMGLAFIEISSSTKKSGETGSLSTWTSKFIGKKSGRGVSLFYITIFFPLTLAALATFAASTFMDALGANIDDPLIWFFFETIIALFILGSIVGLNYFDNRPGKIVQKSGTVFKLIPLILLVFIVLIFTIAPSLQPDSNPDYSWGGVFDPSDSVKNGYHAGNEASGGESFKRFILILPAIMFSFDGFIHAANLQNESKSKNSFTIALVVALLIIIGTYLLFSFSTFAAGYDDFSITAVFLILFPEQEWISMVVTFIIWISIFTTTSGLFIASTKTLSSSSESNIITDTDGEYLRREKTGIVKKSAQTMLILGLAWFVVIRILDLAFLGYVWGTESAAAAVGTKTSSDWLSSLIVLFAFAIYGIILIAGVINRKTERVEVEKNRYFLPLAIISAPLILVITLLYGITIVDGVISDVIYLLHILGFLIMILVFAMFWYHNEKDIKSVDKSKWNSKRKYILAYESLLTIDEWEKNHPKGLLDSEKKELSSRESTISKPLLKDKKIKTKDEENKKNKDKKEDLNSTKTKK